MKSVHTRSLSGRYFPTFGLNTDQKNSEYGHFLCTEGDIYFKSFFWPNTLWSFDFPNSSTTQKKKKKLWPLQLIFTGADVERRLAEEPFWKVKKIHNFIKIFCGKVLLSFFPTQFPKKTRLEELTCRFFEQIF